MIEVPEELRAKTAALGAEGSAWLEALPELVEAVVADWDLEVVGPLGRGGSGYLLGVVAGGRPAVLKLVMPDGLRGNGAYDVELAALRAGRGTFVEVLRSDDDRRILLLERLGTALGDLGWPVERQLEALAATLPGTWRSLGDDPGFPTGDAKAALLIDFVGDLWEETGRRVPAATVDHARRAAERRLRALAPRARDGELVLVHGDGHPFNVLSVDDDASRFRLIDPEGLLSEPAHDLCIPLRGWNEEALATADPAATVLGWCRRLAAACGVDPVAVVEWTAVERVSTGLFLSKLGLDDDAAAYLRVADLVASSP